MRILALNCGSSSIKSALIESDDGRRMLDARVENIGAAESVLCVRDARRAVQARDHDAAIKALLDELGVATESIEAIVHRVVHGGERFVRSTLIDHELLHELERLQHLAPLHNPPAVAAMHAARAALPDIPQVAVFDTAFHSTLPRRAREYALPAETREQYGVRRYGFHGVSHEHVMRSVAAYLRCEPHSLRIISCHLGAAPASQPSSMGAASTRAWA